MKKKLLFSVFLLCSFIISAQNTRYKDPKSIAFLSKISIRLGFNSIDASWDNWDGSTGSTPWENFFTFDNKQANSGTPIKLDLEYRLNETFGFELSVSKNQWKATEGIIDQSRIFRDHDFFAADANIKFYLDQVLNNYVAADWFELYASAGLSYFKIGNNYGDVDNTTAFNLGFGTTFWFTKNLGLNIGTTTRWGGENILKFNTGLNEWSTIRPINSVHTQYTIGVAYRFGKKNKETKVIESDSIKEKNILIKNLEEELSTKRQEIIKLKEEAKAKKLNEKEAKVKELQEKREEKLKQLQIEKKRKEITTKVVLLSRSVRFNFGEEKFTPKSVEYLEKISDLMKQDNDIFFLLVGHTDNAGSEEYNKKLSIERSLMVKKFLTDSGVSGERLEAIGVGESKPLDSNLTENGRRNNRRVEIIHLNL